VNDNNNNAMNRFLLNFKEQTKVKNFKPTLKSVGFFLRRFFMFLLRISVFWLWLHRAAQLWGELSGILNVYELVIFERAGFEMVEY
jgi:hypothetical protein